MLRPRATLDETLRRERVRRGERTTYLWRPFAGDLVEVLVLVGEGTVEYASLERLRAQRISAEEAWRLAPLNIAARVGELTIAPLQPNSPVRIASAGSGLATSVLTGGGRCMERGPAAVVALVIDRGEFIFVDPGAADAETRFFAAARAIIADGLSSSATPIRCVNGVWVAADGPQDRL